MKKILLYLLLLIPVLSFGQALKQSSKTPASGTNAGNQWFQYYSIGTPSDGYMFFPYGTNLSPNRAGGWLPGMGGINWADSSFRAVDPFGHLVSIGKGGSGNGAIYFKITDFSGLGTQVSPIGINPIFLPLNFPSDQTVNTHLHNLTFKNLPNIAHVDSILVLGDNGLVGRAVDNPASSANQIISGLNFRLFTDTTLSVSAGIWRINNHLYSRITDTIVAISKRDSFLYRYDAIYADTLGRIGTVVGVLSADPVIPSIPDNTLFIGSVLITPSGPTLQPVNAYLPLNIINDTNLFSSHSLAFNFTGGTGSMTWNLQHGFGGSFIYMSPFQGVRVAIDDWNDNGIGGQSKWDTTRNHQSYVEPGGGIDGLDMGIANSRAGGIEVQTPTTKTMFAKDSLNKAAIYANPFAFTPLYVVKHEIDSVKGTIPAARTIYRYDDTLTSDRLVTSHTHTLQIGDTTQNNYSVLTIQPQYNAISLTASAVNTYTSTVFATGTEAQVSSNDTSSNVTYFATHATLAEIQAQTIAGAMYNFRLSTAGGGVAGFTDNLNHRGIEYSHINFANFLDSTLVPKKYVVDYVASHSGTGTVTAVSIASANGISGSSSGGATPALTIALGAITPTSTNGVSAATMAFNDATSSIQTQLNAHTTNIALKANIASPTFTGTVTIPSGGIFGTPTSMTATNVTGLPTTALTGALQAAQFPALTGDITTVAGALATTLKNTGTAGTYGQVTTDAQGRVTSGTVINPVANGGTSFATYAVGDILYASGTGALSKLNIGGANTVLHGGTTPSYSAIVNADITNSTIDLTTKVTGLLPNANLANSTISSIALGGTLGALTATDATLTFSGSYTGATARTVGINLSTANTWLANITAPTYLASGSTAFSSSGTTATSNMSIYGTGALGLTNSSLLIGTASQVRFRAFMNGQSSTAISAGDSYIDFGIGKSPITMPSSGVTDWLAVSGALGFGTITNASAIPINNTAVGYFGAASSAGTNNYSGYFGGVIRADFGSDATGDIWYRNSANGGSMTRLGIGATGQFLGVTSGVPAWQTGSLTQATADLTAQTAAGNVTAFTVGASTATFNVSSYINVTAVAVDVIQGQITYTDENNTSQTISLQSLSAIGNSTYNPVTIRAKNATVITVKTNLTTGAGSITFDTGARITQL